MRCFFCLLEGQLQLGAQRDFSHAHILLQREGTGDDLTTILQRQEVLQHLVAPDLQIQNSLEGAFGFNEAIVAGIDAGFCKLTDG